MQFFLIEHTNLSGGFVVNFSVQNCHLFPRVLGEVLGQYNVQELHLSLTQGLWRHEKYGYPVMDAPAGTEIWAWFKEGTEEYENNYRL